MLRSDSDCDDCMPEYANDGSPFHNTLSALPFLLTFFAVTIVVQIKVYPLLSALTGGKIRQDASTFKATSSRNPPSSTPIRDVPRDLPSLAFSLTLALSVVLIELLLCEISNSFSPVARGVALQVTVTSLLMLLVVAIPLIEIHSVLTSLAWKFIGGDSGRKRIIWGLVIAGYGIFLVCFWALGRLLPFTTATQTVLEGLGMRGIVQAGLERLGVAGISLMALLSGFASVSAIWQNFGVKLKPVAAADLERKQAGLDATMEMLAEKKFKLHAVSHKLANAPTQGFWSKTVVSLRGNADTQEKSLLEMEVSGLETMANSLETSLSILKSRRLTQVRAKSTLGRVLNISSKAFASYCVYRIFTTLINVLRSIFGLSPSHGESDPVTNGIAIFARNVYPSLDQPSWARQVSFLLSGVMLLASFSAVMQTFQIFSRFAPSMLSATKSNFALIIAQISGMYVISSALMLRGMMPKELGSVINDALGAGVLEPVWAAKWFDGFFLAAVVLTIQGIWLGRKLGTSSALDDDAWDGDIEMGKRL